MELQRDTVEVGFRHGLREDDRLLLNSGQMCVLKQDGIRQRSFGFDEVREKGLGTENSRHETVGFPKDSHGRTLCFGMCLVYIAHLKEVS